ncbi:unnamed protein product [Zymoseptoria tritici ST99CH_3D1]|nr:unnamed protein product [Zymoseptoria tritici ST99CH_3D1]
MIAQSNGVSVSYRIRSLQVEILRDGRKIDAVQTTFRGSQKNQGIGSAAQSMTDDAPCWGVARENGFSRSVTSR